jgi:hypothetical protein
LNRWVDKSVEEKYREEENFVNGDLHAAIRVYEKGSLFIFADETYFYVINFGTDDDPVRYE